MAKIKKGDTVLVIAGKDKGVTGKVLEKLDAGTYTYLRLATNAGVTWAAVPATTVPVGATVGIAGAMPMDGFESKTLNRKFDKIVFGTVEGAPPAAGADSVQGMMGLKPGSPLRIMPRRCWRMKLPSTTVTFPAQPLCSIPAGAMMTSSPSSIS